MGIFRCRALQVTATWRKLQNEEPHTFALETNISAVSKSRMLIICGIHCVHGGGANADFFSPENLQGRDCLGDQSASWMVI